MQQNHRKFERAERLIQYAIEVFDLVEIVPATSTGRSIGRRSLQPDTPLAARYGEAQSASSAIGAIHRGTPC